MRSSLRVATLWLRSHFHVRVSGIFDPNDAKDESEEAPKARAKKPRAPRAPKKPAPDKKPNGGPAAIDRSLDPLFEKFVEEKYQGGDARVPNPNPKTKKHWPEVSFTTAMGDDGFRRQVLEEFARWKSEQDDKPSESKGRHKRLEIGQTVEHISQLRVGDVIQSDRKGAPKRRIVRLEEGAVFAQEVDDDGAHGHERRLSELAIASGRHKRIADPSSPENKAKREEAKKLEEAAAKKRKDEARAERAKNRGKSPAWAKKQDALLDLIHDGSVVQEQRIGGEGNVNETYKRRMKLGDAESEFVWKPASGEADGDYGPLRTGIERGTYHQREAACYNIDRLLGDGTVVPPTATTGEGSYQAFQRGAHTFYEIYAGAASVPHLTSSELKEHPDFNRMNVLDLIVGHEDRHIGNIMFVRDSKAPSGLRFIAIDNGLALASVDDKSDEYSYCARNPWKPIFGSVSEAVYDSTHSIDPKLHEKVKGIDHVDFVESMVDSGIREESALLAALVRLSALQRNPNILGKLDEDSHSEVTESVRRFLYLAGSRPQFLLEQAGSGPSLEDLQAVVKNARR